MKHLALQTLAVIACLLLPIPAIAAFRCPAADTHLMGEKPTISDDEFAESNGDVSDKLAATIHRMRSEGVKSGEIVDKLVVAYCSHIDGEKSLSEDRKAEQVRRFASMLAQSVYTAPEESKVNILLDVPVPTSIYAHLRQAASKAGVSLDAWVTGAIVDKLGKP
jgi:predicted HicB family RNase H-like nuclease